MAVPASPPPGCRIRATVARAGARQLDTGGQVGDSWRALRTPRQPVTAQRRSRIPRLNTLVTDLVKTLEYRCNALRAEA